MKLKFCLIFVIFCFKFEGVWSGKKIIRSPNETIDEDRQKRQTTNTKYACDAAFAAKIGQASSDILKSTKDIFVIGGQLSEFLSYAYPVSGLLSPLFGLIDILGTKECPNGLTVYLIEIQKQLDAMDRKLDQILEAINCAPLIEELHKMFKRAKKLHDDLVVIMNESNLNNKNALLSQYANLCSDSSEGIGKILSQFTYILQSRMKSILKSCCLYESGKVNNWISSLSYLMNEIWMIVGACEEANNYFSTTFRKDKFVRDVSEYLYYVENYLVKQEFFNYNGTFGLYESVKAIISKSSTPNALVNTLNQKYGYFTWDTVWMTEDYYGYNQHYAISHRRVTNGAYHYIRTSTGDGKKHSVMVSWNTISMMNADYMRAFKPTLSSNISEFASSIYKYARRRFEINFVYASWKKKIGQSCKFRAGCDAIYNYPCNNSYVNDDRTLYSKYIDFDVCVRVGLTMTPYIPPEKHLGMFTVSIPNNRKNIISTSVIEIKNKIPENPEGLIAEVWEHPYFGGDKFELTSASAEWLPSRWTNRISSMKVHSGSVVLYDAVRESLGSSKFYAKGYYTDIGSLNDRVDRIVRMNNEYTGVLAVFYEDPNCQGASFELKHGDYLNVLVNNWNDRISSIKFSVNKAVTICEYKDFDGPCRKYIPEIHGYTINLNEFDNRISSIYTDDYAANVVAIGYEDIDYGGTSFVITSNIHSFAETYPYFYPYSNDILSSIRVFWPIRLYEYPNFTGNSITYDPSEKDAIRYFDSLNKKSMCFQSNRPWTLVFWRLFNC